jgi:MYND finger
MSARYCSDECQSTHWQSVHSKECPKLRKIYYESVVIDKPSSRKGDIADNAVLTFKDGSMPTTSYRRPSHVAIGELFTVKVQRVSGRNTLLIHDKSRECEFCIGPDKKAYKKLLEKVRNEQATAGTKTYMTASFDKKGNCIFYLNQTKIKTW